MKYLLILFFTIIIFTINAQPTFDNVYRNDTFSTFYWKSNTKFTKVILEDDTYYLWGTGIDSSHHVNPSNAWYETGLFSKIDTNGNIINHRIYDDYFSRFYSLNFGMERTTNGDFLIGGSYLDTVSNLLFLMKIDETGDTLWRQFYQPTIPQSPVGFHNIELTKDKGAILLGREITTINPDVSVVTGLLIKVDSLGIEEWRNTYFWINGYRRYTADIIEVGNNYFLLNTEYKGYPRRDWDYQSIINIQKLDSLGNLISFYKSPLNEYIIAGSIIHTKDNGFIIAGNSGIQVLSSNLNDPFILAQSYICKLDSNLQLIWEKTIGNPISTESFTDVQELENGSLVAIGRNVVHYPDVSIVTNQVDSADYLGHAVKFSSDGTLLWKRSYKRWYNTMFGIRHNLRDIEILPDGRLLMAGEIEDNNTFSPTTGFWGWLIRTDSFGCIVPGCQLLDNTENISVVFDNEVVVFPNPVSEVVRFRFEKAIKKDAVIRVYSGLGQLVGQTALPLPQTETEMNVSNWNSDVYYYGIYVEGRLVKQGQILIRN